MKLKVSFVYLTFCSPLFCCLWDYDTLQMERNMFPGAHELIVGYFVRHSEDYYRWRIEDRNKKGDQKTLTDYDDIAVAYDKLGQQDKAISIIKEKMEKWPDEGKYESHANLGTFLIHNGQFEEGLVHIEKAIEINPEAHFGREIYQKLLVEYFIESGYPQIELPLYKGSSDQDFDTTDPVGFAKYIIQQRKPAKRGRLIEIQAATKGVMGMMRFGSHDSPVLLEALGDLLLSHNFVEDAKMLAARAYLMASYKSKDENVSAIYEKKSKVIIDEFQYNWTIERIEKDLKKEVEQGQELLEEITNYEQKWINESKDLD